MEKKYTSKIITMLTVISHTVNKHTWACFGFSRDYNEILTSPLHVFLCLRGVELQSVNSSSLTH